MNKILLLFNLVTLFEIPIPILVRNTKKLENSVGQEWFLLSVQFLTPVAVSVWSVVSVVTSVPEPVWMSSISISSISIMGIVSISVSVSISRPLGNDVGGSNGGDIAVGSVGVRVASNSTIGIWVVGSSVGVSGVGQGWGSNGLNLGNGSIIISLGSLDNGVHGRQAIGETISSIGIWVSVTSIEDCGISLGISLGDSIGSSKQTDNEELHLEQS